MVALDSSYQINVIQAGDSASDHFKKAAREANKESVATKAWILHGNRLVVPASATVTNLGTKTNLGVKIKDLAGHEVQTDGVGTKVRIYMSAFNALYEEYRANPTEAKKEAFLETSKTLFYRMFLDLYAMNVDDFRNGDLALAVSDILDIDHITLTGEDAEQGEIFYMAFAHAIGQIIRNTGIALVAGETAVMGDGDKKIATEKNYGSVVEAVLDLQKNAAQFTIHSKLSPEAERLLLRVKQLIHKAIKAKESQAAINRSVELNLGGSTTGYRNGQKLAPLEAGHDVIAIFERKTEKGIISPRANGISPIRKTMTKLLGDDWPMKTLRDYFDELGKQSIAISDEARERLSQMWLDTPLWDIATGETTVFNPLVGGTLLGGIDGSPLFPGAFSGQLHVTGNPVGKWSDIVAGSGLGIDVDYSEVEIPQIIEMCMIAEWEDFAAGMDKWNMGIPYGITCDPTQTQKVIDRIRQEGYEAEKVGKITQPQPGEKASINIQYPDGGRFSKSVEEVRKIIP